MQRARWMAEVTTHTIAWLRNTQNRGKIQSLYRSDEYFRIHMDKLLQELRGRAPPPISMWEGLKEGLSQIMMILVRSCAPEDSTLLLTTAAMQPLYDHNNDNNNDDDCRPNLSDEAKRTIVRLYMELGFHQIDVTTSANSSVDSNNNNNHNNNNSYDGDTEVSL